MYYPPPPPPHEKKLDKFCQRQLKLYINDSRYYINNTVHNFLSYILSSREELGLVYGLEQHISVKRNKHTIKTEFEVFYQSLLKNISHIPENDISLINTKTAKYMWKIQQGLCTIWIQKNCRKPFQKRKYCDNETR